jgi:MotA/TolQ/ExbB proton channel family
MKLLMLSAATRRRDLPAPRADDSVAAVAQRLFWGWAVMAGLALFVAWWLQLQGLWAALVRGDPSGISVSIVVLSVVVSGWCGQRAWRLQQQAAPGSAWRMATATEHQRSPEIAAQLLAERCHGPHETAWWFAGAAIKLGLLGTVVGFIVMATKIGQVPSFELGEVQTLLKQMTLGMAIALYTTLVGLIGNLWLGLQLLLLDRLADRLAADMLHGAAHAASGAD